MAAMRQWQMAKEGSEEDMRTFRAGERESLLLPQPPPESLRECSEATTTGELLHTWLLLVWGRIHEAKASHYSGAK